MASTDRQIPADYPMGRDARCPLHPARDFGDLQARPALSRMKVWDGSTPWVVTRFADAWQAVSDPRLSTWGGAPGFPLVAAPMAVRTGTSLAPYFVREEPVRAAHRAIAAVELSPQRAQARRPRLRALADEALDAMVDGPRPADLVRGYALPFALDVVCDLLGLDRADGMGLHRLSKLAAGRFVPQADAAAALSEFGDYFRRAVERETAAPGENLTGRALVPRIRTGAISLDDAAALLFALFHAGHGAVAHTIAAAFAALARFPDQMELFRLRHDDPAFVTPAVTELLRFVNVTYTGRARAAVEDRVPRRRAVAVGRVPARGLARAALTPRRRLSPTRRTNSDRGPAPEPGPPSSRKSGPRGPGSTPHAPRRPGPRRQDRPAGAGRPPRSHTASAGCIRRRKVGVTTTRGASTSS